MKKQITLCLAFVVMLISSCQKDANLDQGVGQDGMVDFSITTTLPQGPDAYTRAGTAPENSALGGLANVDPVTHDLRYIMEVWTTGSSPKRVRRVVTTVDNGWATTPAIFDVRLIAQKYNFVFWADFVEQQGSEITEKGLVDLHYNTTTTTGLNNIKFSTTSGGYKVSDDTRDAYSHKEEIDLSVSTNKMTVLLKRPFAKVRYIATDRPQNDATNIVSSSRIEYPNAKFYTEFNAITGLAMGTPSVRNNSTLLTAKPTVETATVGDDYLLVFDYILPGASVTSIGESNIYTVVDGVTASRPNLPVIPIVANTLVTLKGNLYTNRGDVTVSVDDAFTTPGGTDVPVADIEAVKLIGGVNDVIERLAGENATAKNPIGVKVETEVSATTTITIPATIKKETTPAITYDLSAGIANNATLTITAPASADTSSDNYAGTINLIVPIDNVGSVTIDAPNAHVNINGKYTALTAATSATTLVIQAGAIIETLTVTEGNVVIRGNVTTLVNTGGGTVTEYVSSLAQLNIALSRASMINLAGDIDGLAKRIKVENSVIINGNDHTVNVTLLGGFNPTKSLTLNNITLDCINTVGKAPIFINTSNVTITGNALTINQAAFGSGNGTSTSGLGIHVDHVSINNVKIELNDSAINLNATSGQRAIAFSSGLPQSDMVVNLTNTNIIAKTSTSLPNAYNSQAFALAKLVNPKITLKNSVLEGMYYPISCGNDYPEAMQLTIDNSKLTGYCALNLRGTSTVTVKNGSVITGRNYYSGDSDGFATIIYNRGKGCTGSKLIVDNSTIKNIVKGLASQYMIDLRANEVAITLQNNTKLIDCPEAPALELDFMIKDGAFAKPLKHDDTVVLEGKEGVTLVSQTTK